MKKNIFFAIFSAILLVLSFPNFNFSFLIWIALIPLLFVLDGKSSIAAFFLGWLTGFLFFVGTHYWLIHVTLPGMVLVNIYLGIYFGLFGLGYAFFQKLPLKHQLWVLPSLWAALEFARDRLFTGFGWATLGHSQYEMLYFIQIADITGVFGVSFLVVMVSVLLKDLIARKKVARVPTFLKKVARVPTFFVVAVIASVLFYGVIKMGQFLVKQNDVLRVAVIQPNIPQSLKWDPDLWEPTQKKVLALTKQALQNKPDLIIWPEASFPGFVWQSPERYEEIKQFVARSQIPLLMGILTRSRTDQYFNTALLLSDKGEEIARYDKMHLVPFGEFLPLRPLLGWIGKFAPIGDDFSAGQHLTVFPQGFSTLICFEDTVAPVVRKLVRNGAGFLVNITNDGWFKDTNAPYLHLQGSVFQAIGHRRAIIRAANTGVSGEISATGHTGILQNAKGKAVMVDGVYHTQVPLLQGQKDRFQSFYTQYGDVFAYICIFAVGIALIKKKIWL